MRACLTSGAWLVACACSTPPTPAPAVAPSPTATDAAPAIDAAIARGLLDCPAGSRAVRSPWPAHGAACVDAAGHREGPAVELYPDGAIAVRATWHADALDGAWQRLAPDGALVVDGAYRAGRLDGTWRQLAGGVELGRSQLADGTGVLTTWHPTGAIASTTTWKDGVRDGAAQAFAPDGTLVVDETWRAGVREGDHVVGMHATFELRERWHDGVRTGARTIWRRGHLELSEHYDRKGALDGDWASYRGARQVREQGRYDGGARTGPWTWFDAGGNPIRTGSYARGKRDGAWTESTGKVVTWTGSYRAGLPDGAFVTFDRRGKELGRDVLEGGTGVLRTFHANGRTETETPLRRGVAHGLFRQLTARGTVIASGHFVDGERDGVWWRQSGDARREATYAGGALDGTLRRTRGGAPALEATYAHGARAGAYREAFADGTPALTGQFVDDARDGEWITYRPDGTVAIRAHYQAGLLDGAWQELDAGGTARVSGQLQRGHRVGVWTTIDASGAITTVDHGAAD